MGRFLKHEVVADLGVGNFLSFDFAVQLGLVIMACWLRIYVHYLGAPRVGYTFVVWRPNGICICVLPREGVFEGV